MNKLKSTYIFIISFLFLAITSCNNDNKLPIKKQFKQINFIVLLDLSDRIIKSKDQADRDIEIIENVFNLFKKEVQKKAYIKSKDQFKIIIANQNKSKIDKVSYENKFYINLENEKIATKRKKVEEVSLSLKKNLNMLYSSARFSQNYNDYNGADIWEYFNDDLETDLIISSDSKNILVIISDGYLIVKNRDRLKNQSIKKINKKFNNLSVSLLEINQSEYSDNEYSQLTKSWENWFRGMNILNLSFQQKENIDKVNDRLENFIKKCLKNESNSNKKKNVENIKNEKAEIRHFNDKPIINKDSNRNKKTQTKDHIVNNIYVTKKITPFFKTYMSLKDSTEKTVYIIKNIINLREIKYTTSELKIISSDLFHDLEFNFPEKNEITRYSFCCSSKEKILTFLKKYGYKTLNIEENFKTNCPN